MSDENLAIVREADTEVPEPTKIGEGRWEVRVFDFQGEGAIVIPPEIVEALGLHEGCVMEASIENGAAVFTKVPEGD